MRSKLAHFDMGFSFEFDTPSPSISSAIEKVEEGDELESKIQLQRLHLNLPDTKIDPSLNNQEMEEQEKGKEQYFDSTEIVGIQDFESMDLSKPVLKSLSTLGYKTPTPIQQKAIPVALLGRDICGSAETGSGKTAAFIIPIIERLLHRNKKIIISRVLLLLPTRELAVQCYDFISKLTQFCTSISYVLLAGGLAIRPQEAELKKRPDILIATPGRLIDHIKNTPSFDLDSIEILVLDEADRMLEEGFADELNEIIKSCPKSRQTMLFSASMTENVDDLIRISLRKPIRLFVDESTKIAHKLFQEFVRIREDKEDDRWPIMLYLCRLSLKRAIVFFPTKELAHKGRILLGLCGLTVSELHGGLTQAKRIESLNRFKSGISTHLVATDVAARGLDVSSVETVIMYNMPASYSMYQHRVGRTARAGKFGKSISLVGEGSDRKVLKQVIKNSTERPKHRVIAPETLNDYRQLFKSLLGKLSTILEEERTEKIISEAERDITKAENLIKYEGEIKSRSRKEWFQNGKEKERSKKMERAQSLNKNKEEKVKSKPKDRKTKIKSK